MRWCWPLFVLALAGCGAGFAANDESSGAPGDGSADGTGGSGGGAGVMSAGGGGATGGGGGNGPAGGRGGAGGADGCVIPLSDDFTSPTLDGNKWLPWGSSQAGPGVLQINWSGGANEHGGVHSAAPYSLLDCSVFIELTSPPSSNQSQAFMYLGLDTENRVGFYVANGTLHFAIRINAVSQNVDLPFDPVAHRFWRLREENGTVYWYTSPDALQWTERREASTPNVGLDDGIFNIGAGTLAATTAGYATFDNFNVVATP